MPSRLSRLAARKDGRYGGGPRDLARLPARRSGAVPDAACDARNEGMRATDGIHGARGRGIGFTDQCGVIKRWQGRQLLEDAGDSRERPATWRRGQGPGVLLNSPIRGSTGRRKAGNGILELHLGGGSLSVRREATSRRGISIPRRKDGPRATPPDCGHSAGNLATAF